VVRRARPFAGRSKRAAFAAVAGAAAIVLLAAGGGFASRVHAGPKTAASTHGHTVGSPWRWEGVERIVAVGDVHGASEELVRLLRDAGLVNEWQAWTGGTTHLVALGDLEDRGPGGRRVMDLLMKLQPQAKAAGGEVHVVMGNHEVLGLVGDFRYVSREDAASFVADEPRGVRTSALAREGQRAAEEGLSAEEADRRFGERYPPGFFGRRAAFSARGTYGKWMFGLPVAVVLNGTAFVHGGPGPLLAEAAAAGKASGHDPLDALTESAQRDLRSFFDAERDLQAAGLIRIEDSFTDSLNRMSALVAASESDGSAGANPRDPAREKILVPARRYIAIRDSLLLRPDGPLWYRAGADEAVEVPRLDAALASLDARRMVVGHTPTEDHRIAIRFGGRLIGVDTGMLFSVYGGRPAALIFEGDRAMVRYAGEKPAEVDLAPPSTPPVVPPPFSPAPADAPASSRPELSDAEIEGVLETAEIVKTEHIGTGITKPQRLTLRSGGTERRAIFKTVREEIVGMVHAGNSVQMSHADKFVFEIAAYRLDRLIGLDMVPVTVPRTVDRVQGSLQDWVENSVQEGRRKADGFEPPDESVLERQRELMHLFDTLIYNTDRNSTNILVTPSDWKIHLIDHSRSFRLESRPPEALKGIAIPVPAALRERLAALDLPLLKSRLGELLSTEQMKAILKRRDGLLRQTPAVPS